jgi:hypothetical protein
MSIPNPGHLLRTVTSLPGSIILFNRSVTDLTQATARLDTLLGRIERLAEAVERPLTALGQTEADVASIVSSVDRLTAAMDQVLSLLAGSVTRPRGERPPERIPGRPGPRVEEA